MKIHIPSDCGNAPRIGVVSDFVSAWAKNDVELLAGWVTDDVTWLMIGTGSSIGSDALADAVPGIEADALHLQSVITHGRLAACDGYLEGDTRLFFSHVFRFKNTAKTSKIAEIRTYLIRD